MFCNIHAWQNDYLAFMINAHCYSTKNHIHKLTAAIAAIMMLGDPEPEEIHINADKMQLRKIIDNSCRKKLKMNYVDLCRCGFFCPFLVSVGQHGAWRMDKWSDGR